MRDRESDSSAPALRPGVRVLDRYLVDDYLSRGGMGEVYVGHHELLEYPVALKVIRAGATEELQRRFLREATLMARVRHPNVVGILDFGILDSGWPCLAMEFLEGQELGERLAAEGPMPWPEALATFSGVLAGLERVHAAEVLHRDLKPSNIVLTEGPPEVAKLIDFGIALGTGHDGSTRYTESGMAVGTPEFMAPEQLLCEGVDGRSDLYSSALVLYCMLTGASPFASEGLSGAIRRFTSAIPRPMSPPHLEEVPDTLQQLVCKMLSPLPDDRLQTAAEFRRCVDDIWRGRDLPPSRPREPRPETPPAHAGSGDATAPIRSPRPPEVVAPLATEPQYALIGARLPAARLKAKEDRVWLASVVRGLGRAYSIGSQFWFVSLETSGPVSRSREVDRITESIRERFGLHTPVGWCPIEGALRLSTASLTGAKPLPVEMQDLIRELTTVR